MGCMGMSLSDFERLTPQEYNAAAEAYGKHQDAADRGSWERMRLLAQIVISPHVKHCPTPEKLIPLPWDKKNKSKAKDPGKKAALARMQEVMKKVGKG